MEKELNLIEILKNVPKGTKLYSPIFCECEFEEVNSGVVYVTHNGVVRCFSYAGRYYEKFGECLLFPSRENRDWSNFKANFKADFDMYSVGEYVKSKESERFFKIAEINDGGLYTMYDLVTQYEGSHITISTENLHENFFVVHKFDFSSLKPFDKVLIRDGDKTAWFASSFSNLGDECYPYVITNGCGYKSCVPYNDETKDLLGTDNEEPDFYKKDL